MRVFLAVRKRWQAARCDSNTGSG